jgi:carboxymethylenebutenolidase
MCDDEIHQGQGSDAPISRRAFGVMTAAMAGGFATSALAADVVEKDVDVKTPDGVADAALFHPAGKGTWPAVLIWTDIAGLRPAFRDMGRRLAAQGYVVLVPNPFYRSAHAPVVDATFDFNKPEDRARVFGYRAAMTSEGVDKDSVAYLAFLDSQPQTDRKKKAGVQGYCMGGPLTFRTAAAVPSRIGAAATFHGAGLVAKGADSPHLLIPRTQASFACCVAQNDDKREPEAKDVLKAAFAAANRPATVEVYPADHGWCVKGSAVYNEPAAEKAWGVLTELYRTTLA